VIGIGNKCFLSYVRLFNNGQEKPDFFIRRSIKSGFSVIFGNAMNRLHNLKFLFVISFFGKNKLHLVAQKAGVIQVIFFPKL
jgi:hypothetical protein